MPHWYDPEFQTVVNRKQFLLGGVDPSETYGVEIGPLHAPVVSKSEGNVLYVDYTTADILRQTFRHQNANPADVCEVDLIWGSHPLNEMIPNKLDYAVASHVIEHVPDLIGWLLELHATLKCGASLGLAVPDKRHTFDQYRQESSVAEMIEAYLSRRRIPSVRQVFEAMALSKDKPSLDSWRPESRGCSLPHEMLERLPSSFTWLKDVYIRNPHYIDVHCWVFTPISFLDIAESLAAIGCFPFEIAELISNAGNSIEFLVRLKTRERSDDPVVSSSIENARRLLNDL